MSYISNGIISLTSSEFELVDNLTALATSGVGEFLRKTGTTTFENATPAELGLGTVTSVAAITLGTTGTDLSSTIANGTTTPVITLNVPTASAANRGALSAADWSTFNGKQPAGSYLTSITGLAPDTATTQATQPNITSLGTLTALQVDNLNLNGNIISSTDTNGNITLTPNGTGYTILNGSVGIGTTAPTHNFEVIGAAADSSSRIAYFRSNKTSSPNTSIEIDSPTDWNSNVVFKENNTDKFMFGYNANYSTGGRVPDTFELYSFVSAAPIMAIHQSAPANSLYINSLGNVGIGTTVPTALLNIKAGTATASTAPLKLTQASAVVLTTPEPGAIECNDGDALYYTIKTGSARKTIAFTDTVPASHAASHAVGAADTVFPTDPGADRYLKWNDTSNAIEWATVAGGSGITRTVESKATDFTAGATASVDYVYFLTGTTTCTLPTAVGNTNRYTIKSISGTSVVACNGAETIDGSATIGIQNEDSVDLVSNNTEWKVV